MSDLSDLAGHARAECAGPVTGRSQLTARWNPWPICTHTQLDVYIFGLDAYSETKTLMHYTNALAEIFV